MTRPTRTLTLRGPFTDDDITAFWQLMQSMEARLPDEHFSLLIDDPVSDEKTAEMFERINRVAPVAEGYARTLSWERLSGQKKDPPKGH